MKYYKCDVCGKVLLTATNKPDQMRFESAYFPGSDLCMDCKDREGKINMRDVWLKEMRAGV